MLKRTSGYMGEMKGAKGLLFRGGQILVFSFLAFILLAGPAAAPVPAPMPMPTDSKPWEMIKFSGRLTDDQGIPLTGSHTLKFIIENSVGDQKWPWVLFGPGDPESHTKTLTNGIFDVFLGWKEPISMTFGPETTYYLKIWVDDIEMGRQRLMAVPLANTARKAQYLFDPYTPKDGTQNIDGNLVVDGNVGIGVTEPDANAKLHVNLPESGNFAHLRIESPVSNKGFGVSFVQPIQEWWIGQNIGNANNGRFQIFDLTASESRLTILTDGNTGIGTKIPKNRLDVEGGAVIGTAYSGTETAPGDGLLVEGKVRIGTTDAYFPEAKVEVVSDVAGDIGIVGRATDDGATANFGSIFTAAGGTNSRGVSGFATKSGAIENYGGYFKASGNSGRGVYGWSTGIYGRGVYGEATNIGNYTNYGGYFSAAGDKGRGVYGEATDLTSTTYTYGGYFQAAGNHGIGVMGTAKRTGGFTNYGGYFTAKGDTGIGVYAEGGTNGYDFLAQGGWQTTQTGEHINNWASLPKANYYAGGAKANFYAGGPGVDFASSSSIRWKSNITPIENALEKVVKLRGVNFVWDQKHGGKHDIGMIAEEVGAVIPEVVTYEDNGRDASGMDYARLTTVLVEAVKELKAENDKLKSRIEALETGGLR